MLELGGKSPNIILDDADLEAAVKAGAAEVFFNSGQSCDSPTRMLVPKDKMDEAAAAAAEVANATVVGERHAGLLYYVTHAYDPAHPDEERRACDSVDGFSWGVEHR